MAEILLRLSAGGWRYAEFAAHSPASLRRRIQAAWLDYCERPRWLPGPAPRPPKRRINRYPGRCCDCGTVVPTGSGALIRSDVTDFNLRSRSGTAWRVRCSACWERQFPRANTTESILSPARVYLRLYTARPGAPDDPGAWAPVINHRQGRWPRPLKSPWLTESESVAWWDWIEQSQQNLGELDEFLRAFCVFAERPLLKIVNPEIRS